MGRLIKICGFFLLLALGGLWLPVKADHITGGEMYYTHVGVEGNENIYKVVLRLLMRCNSGRSFPNPAIIGVFSKEDNNRLRDFAVPLITQGTISLNNTDPCISNPPPVCFEVAEYSFLINVPVNPAGYILAASVNFRVNGLANLAPTGNIGATYTAEIPGTLAAPGADKNMSAHFTGSDLVVVCANSPFKYSFAANDADGDELEYFFCGAYQSGSSAGTGTGNGIPPIRPPYPEVPYGPGFSPNAPLGDNVKINSATGLVEGIAPGTGTYVITVCVAEKRNGKVIAVQRKDIQLSITGCTVAAALLAPSYQLCKQDNFLTFENLSGSPLIQTYDWELLGRNGARIAASQSFRFTHFFSDTGLYRVVLRTNVGLPCPDSTSSPVRYYPGFVPDFTFNGLCFGNPTRFLDNSVIQYGTVKAYVWQLGEPSNPFNLQQVADPSINYLSNGTKRVQLKVENTNGCVDSIAKTLSISTEHPIVLNLRDTLICAPDTLKIKVEGGGLVLWENAHGVLSGIDNAELTVAPLTTTVYRVTQNLDNCVGTDSVRVRVTPQVNLSVMNDTIVCSGDPLRLRASGNALRYEWTPAANVSSAVIAQPIAIPSLTTTYTVTGYISQCTAMQDITVTTFPYPQVNAGPDQSICFGSRASLFVQSNANRIQWIPASSIDQPAGFRVTASPLQTTQYIVAAYHNVGCPKPAYDTVVVQVEAPVILSGAWDTSIVIGQPLQLNMTGAPYYQWMPATYIDNPSIANPIIRVLHPSEGIDFTVRGFNNSGCEDSIMFRVKVFATVPSIFVPTAFTPNGDGLNETLRPVMAGMQKLNYFRVFNRYGEMVYNVATIDEGWDGRYKGEPQSSGAFMWMVSALDYEGKPYVGKGTVVLIR